MKSEPFSPESTQNPSPQVHNAILFEVLSVVLLCRRPSILPPPFSKLSQGRENYVEVLVATGGHREVIKTQLLTTLPLIANRQSSRSHEQQGSRMDVQQDCRE